MEKKDKDKRRFPRIKTELLVRYKILTTPERQIDAQTKDISTGGLCLVAREKIPPSSFLMLEIRFPQTEAAVAAYGRVVWSRESSLGLSPAGHVRFDNGIEFAEIADTDRQRIEKYINFEQKKLKQSEWKIGIVRDLSDK